MTRTMRNGGRPAVVGPDQAEVTAPGRSRTGANPLGKTRANPIGPKKWRTIRRTFRPIRGSRRSWTPGPGSPRRSAMTWPAGLPRRTNRYNGNVLGRCRRGRPRKRPRRPGPFERDGKSWRRPSHRKPTRRPRRLTPAISSTASTRPSGRNRKLTEFGAPPAAANVSRKAMGLSAWSGPTTAASSSRPRTRPRWVAGICVTATRREHSGYPAAGRGTSTPRTLLPIMSNSFFGARCYLGLTMNGGTNPLAALEQFCGRRGCSPTG